MLCISKTHIPRRAFLRGAGVTIALPFLEAMAPAQTLLKSTAATPATRFVGVWHPHGAAPGWWHPKGSGKNFEYSVITQPLESLRDHVVFVSGLDATSSMSTANEPGGDHQRGAAFLTGARAQRDSAIPTIGRSIDQIIAKKFG